MKKVSYKNWNGINPYWNGYVNVEWRGSNSGKGNAHSETLVIGKHKDTSCIIPLKSHSPWPSYTYPDSMLQKVTSQRAGSALKLVESVTVLTWVAPDACLFPHSTVCYPLSVCGVTFCFEDFWDENGRHALSSFLFFWVHYCNDVEKTEFSEQLLGKFLCRARWALPRKHFEKPTVGEKLD